MLQLSSVSTRIKGPHMQMQRTRARIRFLIYNYRFLINRIRLWIADKIRGLFGSFALFFYNAYIVPKRDVYVYVRIFTHLHNHNHTHAQAHIYIFKSTSTFIHLSICILFTTLERKIYAFPQFPSHTHADMDIWICIDR